MVEVNRAGVYIACLAVLLFLRNIFFSSAVLATYPLYPFRMNGNFIRCSNSYFSAKGTKPLHRMICFNLVRCMIPEIIKELVFKGKIVLWEIRFVFCCCITYTILFHFIPLRVWRRFRFVWGWLLMEYYTKHASDLIDNRNQLELLGSHNFFAFFLFLYMESNSMLTAAMFEGLCYGELSPLQIPYTVYDGAYNYFVAIPVCYLLQIVLLGSNLQLMLWPKEASDLWWQKTHLSGWQQVDMRSEEYGAHWLYTVLITAIFVGISSRLDVYRRIKWLEDYGTITVSDTPSRPKKEAGKGKKNRSKESSTSASPDLKTKSKKNTRKKSGKNSSSKKVKAD